MTALLAVTGITVIIVLGLALALPCPACQKRRERLMAALARQRSKNSS